MDSLQTVSLRRKQKHFKSVKISPLLTQGFHSSAGSLWKLSCFMYLAFSSTVFCFLVNVLILKEGKDDICNVFSPQLETTGMPQKLPNVYISHSTWNRRLGAGWLLFLSLQVKQCPPAAPVVDANTVGTRCGKQDILSLSAITSEQWFRATHSLNKWALRIQFIATYNFPQWNQCVALVKADRSCVEIIMPKAERSAYLINRFESLKVCSAFLFAVLPVRRKWIQHSVWFHM